MLGMLALACLKLVLKCGVDFVFERLGCRSWDAWDACGESGEWCFGWWGGGGGGMSAVDGSGESKTAAVEVLSGDEVLADCGGDM